MQTVLQIARGPYTALLTLERFLFLNDEPVHVVWRARLPPAAKLLQLFGQALLLIAPTDLPYRLIRWFLCWSRHNKQGSQESIPRICASIDESFPAVKWLLPVGLHLIQGCRLAAKYQWLHLATSNTHFGSLHWFFHTQDQDGRSTGSLIMPHWLHLGY